MATFLERMCSEEKYIKREIVFCQSLAQAHTKIHTESESNDERLEKSQPKQ